MTIEALDGLRAAEVEDRIQRGLVNTPVEPPGRSLGAIIAANAFTPVNAIMFVLFILILISGHWRDGLFVGVVVSNTVIGVVQEVRTRSALKRLQVLTEPRVNVHRDGEVQVIDVVDIVADDVIDLAPGDQVAVDGPVLRAVGLQMDESMLTGESLPVHKSVGDEVLSGSFVVSGSGIMRAQSIGAESYASKLTLQAKEFRATDSPLRASINTIIRALTIVIPIGSGLLLWSLLSSQDRWQDALQGTVAAAVSMVPDGLVLLTSLAFAAGILELLRRKALAKELSTVEVLARVDVICLDKTGTITTGDITFETIHPLNHTDKGAIVRALRCLAGADEAPNASMAAISAGLGSELDDEIVAIEPFSSTRKWSATCFSEQGWIYLGAPDMLLDPNSPHRAQVDTLSEAGQRLLAVGRSAHGPDGDDAPADLEPMALVELRDELRPDAEEILGYFRDQGVAMKVISGDNPDTVAAIAQRAGMTISGEPIDARTLPADPIALGERLDANTVFGRVAPEQKQAMVHALQARGHIVAMTGDGVNDVLALKDADLGIAMGAGSAASRSVADLVLTDNRFSTLPVVVDEGRKVINNVERVANLFVTKAIYAVIITMVVAIMGAPFPFLPRQLTLIGSFSIGIPGFFLALAPESDRIRDGFLTRVLRFSIPAGILASAAVMVAYEIARRTEGISLEQARTLATMTMLGIGLAILISASRPLKAWKVGLAIAMACCYGVILVVPPLRRYFELHLMADGVWIMAGACGAVAGLLILLLPRLIPGIARPR